MTLQDTGGTEPLSFEALGLPDPPFLQDPLEPGRRPHDARPAAGGLAPSRGGR